MNLSPAFPPIILASSSPYRKEQLQGLGLEITGVAPKADENTVSTEDFPPQRVAEKRAQLKTKSISAEQPEAVVIGGDQLVHWNDQVLGKPGSEKRAVEQLQQLAGETHQLITACEIHFRGETYCHTDVTELTMRSLKLGDIEEYVRRDQPLNCAGAYKIESLGPWLFEKIQTNDHTAITGLPLFFITKTLQQISHSLKN